MSAADQAPALSRGLAILQQLARDGASSLEQVARKTGFPKTSVLRLLQCLEQAGAARRDPVSRRYAAVMRLVPVVESERSTRLRCAAALVALADAAVATAELWCPVGEQLVLVDRCDAEAAVVTARAPIGHRYTVGELGAIGRIYLGVTQRACFDAHWNGESVADDTMASALDEARTHLWAVDPSPNLHGVFRYAAAVVDRTGNLEGCLAIAQVVAPQTAVPNPALIDLVRSAARSLQV